MTPAALSVARTRSAFIGVSRMRTPVASKNAFATAAPTGTWEGSPAPVTGHVAASAAMGVGFDHEEASWTLQDPLRW